MTLCQALWMVRLRQAKRIAASDPRKGWREGETVKHEVLAK